MGGVSSQSSIVSNAITAINDTVINTMSNVQNSQSQACSTVQNLTVNIKGNIQVKNFKTDQVATVTCNLDAKTSTQVVNQMNVDIENKIDSLISQSSKSVQELLSLSANQQNSTIDNKTFLKNTISQTIENSIHNVCAQTLSITQGQAVTIENTTQFPMIIDNIDISQHLQGIAMASCITNNLVSTLANNTSINDLLQKIEQASTSEQKGLSALMGPLLLLAGIALIGFLVISGKAGNIVQDPKKVVMLIAGLAIAYLALAAVFKWTPFHKSDKSKEKFLMNNILQKPYVKYNKGLNAYNTVNYDILG